MELKQLLVILNKKQNTAAFTTVPLSYAKRIQYTKYGIYNLITRNAYHS